MANENEMAEREDRAWEEWFEAIKADAAYCLGLEEGSEEWEELMAI